jgi:Fe-S cluster biogenesis protein NfuA/nitrite reductase/ring-hydroxylating ferredoxin subunit
MGRPGSESQPEKPSDSADFAGDAQWRGAGDRIQTLLDATAAGGTIARERAEQLVCEVVDVYGAGLHRIIDLVDDPATLARLVADDLVASLLLVHGLHPHDVHRRVSDALDSVRPYLGSHGGDVSLLGVDDGVVRLQFQGSCKSCPSSSVTLELAVEDAVRAAAPEISSIEVVAAEPELTAAVIPAESLLARVHADGHGPTTWHQVPELGKLSPGEVGGFLVADTTVLACRVGDQLFAYRDHCPGCDGSLAGAALHRGMGASADPVLRCPRCHAHFDVVHAGAGMDQPDLHLDPMPLLIRDGVLSVAHQDLPTGLSA